MKLCRLSGQAEMDYRRTVKEMRLVDFLVAMMYCLNVKSRLQG